MIVPALPTSAGLLPDAPAGLPNPAAYSDGFGTLRASRAYPAGSGRAIVPKHVALIMDGNGRWAQQRGLPRAAGHKAGIERIGKVLEACDELGIHIVSGYAWSTENWGRPKSETDAILNALEQELPRFARELHKRNVRFVHSGSRSNLSRAALCALDDALRLTRLNGPRVFNLAFNYGGRNELVEVARKLLAEHLHPDSISESVIDDHLWTAGLPDVDLIIRSGGEQRISNFLLWQSAHACFYVTRTYWPDMARDDLAQALAYYNARYTEDKALIPIESEFQNAWRPAVEA